MPKNTELNVGNQMSIVQLRQIKRRLEETFKPCADVSASKAMDENKFLSSALASYAVMLYGECTAEDAWASLTDGGDDNGIDAIYYHEESARLLLIQSKWINNGRGEPDNASIKKFKAGIEALVSLQFDRFNVLVAAREEEIIQALENPALKIEAIIVYTGASDMSQHSVRDLNDIKSDLNDGGEIFYWIQVNQSVLHASLTEAFSSPINMEINVSRWGKVDEPHLAYYGQISAEQIADMWKSHGDKLVARNLRGPLGTTDVNEEMRQSLGQRSELFWYLNNGITATAKVLQKLPKNGSDRDYAVLRCEDVSVVNGAQTLSTIGEFRRKNPDADLSECSIQFRVISIADGGDEFGNEVTRANNRQNKIESRDFVAQDPEQKRIRKELLVDDVQYQVLRNEDVVRGENSFDLQDSTIALACATGDVTLAVTLKSQIGRLWDDITKAPYKSLFNPSVSGMYVWRCVQTQRMIDKAIDFEARNYKKPRQRKILIYGNRLISSIVFHKIGVGQFEGADFPFDSSITQEKVGAIVHDVIYQVIEYCQRFHPSAMIPNLFKNQARCRPMHEKVIREVKVQ